MNNTKRKIFTKVTTTITIILLTTIVNQYGTHLYANYRENIAYQKSLIQQEIDFIDKQLVEFYIPLNIQLERSKRLFLDFKTKYKDRNSILDIDESNSEEDRLRWRIYLLSVFKSTHIRMEDLVISKRHLSSDNKELNNKLNILEKHINQYKVIFKKWGDGNTDEDVSPVHFPDTLNDLIKRGIKKLQLKKEKLLTE